jgi:hypothetical protein
MTDGSIRQLAEWVVVLVLTCGAFYLFLYLRDKFYRQPDLLEPDVDGRWPQLHFRIRDEK